MIFFQPCDTVSRPLLWGSDSLPLRLHRASLISCTSWLQGSFLALFCLDLWGDAHTLCRRGGRKGVWAWLLSHCWLHVHRTTYPEVALSTGYTGYYSVPPAHSEGSSAINASGPWGKALGTAAARVGEWRWERKDGGGEQWESEKSRDGGGCGERRKKRRTQGKREGRAERERRWKRRRRTLGKIRAEESEREGRGGREEGQKIKIQRWKKK